MKRFWLLVAAFLFLFPISTANAFTFIPLETAEGLRVWLLPQENAKTIRIVVHIPIGGSMDPKRKQGLAHFVEHMLFTDNDGRDELEFFKELENHGGKANGYTQTYETVYTVAAPAEKTELALDWVRRLLFDHQFKAEAVEKERKIIMLESNLTPPEISDYINQLFDWLDIFERPSFWEEEFGFKPYRGELGGSYHSVMKIQAEDIQKFYEDHYRLGGITLFVAGGFDVKEVKRAINKKFFHAKTFQHLNRGSSPWVEPPKLKQRNRYRQQVEFINSGSLGFDTKFKIGEPTQEDVLTMFFLSDFLSEYLNDELRFKERATYGVWTYVGLFKNASFFQIGGDFSPEDIRKSKAKVEETLGRLADARFSPQEFEEYRKRAQADLKLRTNSPELMANRFQEYYFNGFIFESFPDQLGFYEKIGMDQVQKFCEKHFRAKHQIVSLKLRSPFSETIEQLVTIVFLLVFFYVLRNRWIRPVDLKELRYLRKFRVPIPQLIVIWSILFTIYVFYQGALRFSFRFIEDFYGSFENYWLHFAANLLIVGIWFYLSVIPFTFYPRKILLFKDYLLIKCATFRSWKIPYVQLQTVELKRFPCLFQWKKLGLTWPIGFGILKPTIYLKARGFPAFFFNTRNNQEFMEKIADLRSSFSKEMSG